MKITKTIPLTLVFRVTREDPIDEEWEVALESVEPRGAFGNSDGEVIESMRVCTSCSDLQHGGHGGGRHHLCDACAVEEIVTCDGEAGFFNEVVQGFEIDREGKLTLVGRMSWSTFSTPQNGDDCEVEFSADSHKWEDP